MTKVINQDAARQEILVASLTAPRYYRHPVQRVERLETHISHVLLAGDYAYKIKKPLNLGFLDFTSLERRKYYCLEELRLNRRLAPEIYLDCIPICGTAENPVLGGDCREAMEYAVKMARFPQNTLLSQRLSQGGLQQRHVNDLARQLAEFHASIARAATETAFGSPDHVHTPVMENFRDMRALLPDNDTQDPLQRLADWSEKSFQRLRPTLAARKAEGFIRECHGDLHLGNMILHQDRIVIFDCIEFNDDLRWIDVMNDLAFLYMDLCYRGVGHLARRLLNVYLEHTGDYAGLKVLSYYVVYRAMVRAKIAAIRLHQSHSSPHERQAVAIECRSYVDLALQFSHRAQHPFLLITHGLSGSGKSHLTAELLAPLRAVRLRSDVERKRLFGLKPLQNSHSTLDQGLYTTQASTRTYQRLADLAEEIIEAGYPVLVDATFLQAQQRRMFSTLANRLGVPFVLLWCQAAPEVLRERVIRRHEQGGDAAEADIAVLDQQLEHYSPPSPAETPIMAFAQTKEELVCRKIIEHVRQDYRKLQANDDLELD